MQFIPKPGVVVFFVLLLSAGVMRSQSEPGGGQGITPEYLHGDWCQRYTPPAEEGFPAPEEEILNLTFRPDGTFLIGRVGSPLKEIGQWSLEDGRLRMTGNPVGGRPTPVRVSDDEFRFRFMGIDVHVHRGHCKDT